MKKQNAKKVLLSITPKMGELLDKKCKMLGSNRSEYIRGLIREDLKKELIESSKEGGEQ